MSGRARARRRQTVQLPSAGQTVVSLVLRRVDDSGPWPLTRVLTALGAFDVDRVGVARALGDRRGVPLVHSQELRWREQTVFLEARRGRDGVDELILELPPWDDLTAAIDHEDVWLLIDAVAAASDAQFGSIGDGEPPDTVMPEGVAALRSQLHRHLALLLPEWAGDDVAAARATPARVLDDSGLLVVTA